MTVAITVRDVPDETRDELAGRAATRGKSLQEYLRSHLVEMASRPDPESLVARIRERKQRLGTTLPVDSIIDHRDADRT